MKQIAFSNEEREVMIQLLDIAVKNPTSGGLKVSQAASYLASKFADPAPEQGDDVQEEPESEGS